jgi:hypothetical protein
MSASTILIFLTLSLTNTSFPSWWGTKIAAETVDAMDTAIQIKGVKFGPEHW